MKKIEGGNLRPSQFSVMCHNFVGRSALVLTAAIALPNIAHALEVPTDYPDWAFRFDNTVTYDVGMRAEGINSNIGNSLYFQHGDYKFSHVGDIVTNRIEDLMEFSAVYKDNYGVDVSALGWKDFAYNNNVRSNPGNYNPTTSYAALNTYGSSQYSNYTDRYYIQSAQLQNAFVFGNFDAGGYNSTIRVGRLVEYWGNTIFLGSQGIDYSQNAADGIKASSQPGTPTKELAIPRTQIYAQTQLTPEITLAAQYFLEYYHDHLPEGGTYLGPLDFLFNGPNNIILPVNSPFVPAGYVTIGNRGPDTHPGNMHGNYGLKGSWSPSWLRGTLSAYFRHYDDVAPTIDHGYTNIPFAGYIATNYHIAYPGNTTAYGLSLDKQIGDYSFGFEASYRHNAALVNLPTAAAPAQGDTVNLTANILGVLNRSSLFDTGTYIGELGYTHKISVNQNAVDYNACVTSPSTAAATSLTNAILQGQSQSPTTFGCATSNYIAAAATFDPTWLSVFPGVDIDAPFFVEYGILGDSPSAGATVGQNQALYTAGIHALIRQQYNITLQYNGYLFPHTGTATTPSGLSYYTSTTDANADKNWVSLTVSATF